MKVILAADHAGYDYKNIIIKELIETGYEVLDLGTNSDAPDDYPDHATNLATALLKGEGDRGIIICGSGVGVSVAINKYKGIRAGVCHDTYSAHQSVQHDNANVLCMGERVVGIELAKEIAMTFLKAEFSNEPRHVRRLEKISAIENKNML